MQTRVDWSVSQTRQRFSAFVAGDTSIAAVLWALMMLSAQSDSSPARVGFKAGSIRWPLIALFIFPFFVRPQAQRVWAPRLSSAVHAGSCPRTTVGAGKNLSAATAPPAPAPAL